MGNLFTEHLRLKPFPKPMIIHLVDVGQEDYDCKEVDAWLADLYKYLRFYEEDYSLKDADSYTWGYNDGKKSLVREILEALPK